MIDILLATYNGEKYINTQISSIVNQTFSNWKLYIHDDGSTDRTRNLIKKWCELDKRIIFVDDGIFFHNPAENFMHLLSYSTSEYICFADQDDYWLEYKLERMIEAFGNNSCAKLLVSSCFLWNTKKGSVIQKSLFSRAFCLEEFLFLNGGLQGCAMLFNAELRKIALKKSVDYTYMHDHFISLVAFTFGSVIYMDDPLFLYRQYEGNASVHIEESKIARIKQVALNTAVPVIYYPSYNGIKAFYEAYKSEVSENSKKLLSDYLKLPSLRFWKRFFKLSRSRFSLGNNGKIKLLLKVFLRPFCAEELLNGK